VDQQHDEFSSRLQRTLEILRPHIPEPKNGQTNATSASSKTTAADLGFSQLKLHNTPESNDTDAERPVAVKDLPSVPSVDISLDDANLEENFFPNINTFFF
jgi:hypothetical protein